MSDLSPFTKPLSPWQNQKGPNDDIVLSTRIRFARNIKGFPFPNIAPRETKLEINNIIKDSFSNKLYGNTERMHMFNIEELSIVDRILFVEKHIISPALLKDEHGSFLLSSNEQVSIMINEEDHIRLQTLYPGLQLREAFQLANEVDNWLEEKLEYAYHEDLGYLTSCPSNVGTGLRASVMIHLPALVLCNQLDRFIPAINQLGFAVRGIYGEGSKSLGNLFQISNQMTLGKSEEDIVVDLESVVIQIVEQEKLARGRLLKNSKIELENRVMRSYGVLKYSRMISSKEAAERLSDVLLGINLEFITQLSKFDIKELITVTQPGFLQKRVGRDLNPQERDIKRAELIRSSLS